MPTIRFFFNDTATTEIYTLSLHDALPILVRLDRRVRVPRPALPAAVEHLHEPHPPLDQSPRRQALLPERLGLDRKSTRLNSSHANISYAVFCLKKKKHSASRYQASILTSP